jgi:thioredoxin-like negative regulator of GroEL
MKIIEVTPQNISNFNNTIINPKQKAIIKFYADWCGHCQELNKIWPDIQNELKNDKGNGILASVSEPMMGNVNCQKDIMGFPSIWYMVGGKRKIEYMGKRDIKSLAKFIKQKLGPCRKTYKRKSKKGKKRKKKTSKMIKRFLSTFKKRKRRKTRKN